MGKFLETQPSNTESKTENLNRLLMDKETESAIKDLPPQKAPGEMASLKSTKHSKELTPIFLKLPKL